MIQVNISSFCYLNVKFSLLSDYEYGKLAKFKSYIKTFW